MTFNGKRREALELHATEMEMAFIYGPPYKTPRQLAYEEALERISNGSIDPEDVKMVLEGC